MTIGRAFGAVLSVIVVGGVIYYVFEQAGKPAIVEPLEPILRIRRAM